MGEDNKNLRNFMIIDDQDGEEIPLKPIQELIADLSMITDGANISGAIEQLKQATVKFTFNLKELNNAIKQYKKALGDYPITKKRTKKILMSRGYSRNEANALLEDIEHRTMSHLDKFFPKNN